MKNWQFRLHLHQEPENIKAIGTRMYSSRMRTARLLTVSVVFHGVCLPGGVSARGGEGICPGEGVSAQGRECLPRGGSVCPGEGVSAHRRECLPKGVSERGVSTTPIIFLNTQPPAHCMLGYKPNAHCMVEYTSPVDRRNDTRLWKHYLEPNFVCER